MSVSGEARKRAVVLGGGGPVGVGWEVGIAAGLAGAGVDLRAADLIVGTSAGSITGAKLGGDEDIAELYAGLGHLFDRSVGESGADQVPEAGLAQLMELMFRSADVDQPPEVLRAEIGALALAADTISEEAFVGGMEATFGDVAWPDRFACTAVDTATGEFVVWDHRSDVPLAAAVASSCSVPAIYPPITIDGRRYMDGGMRSALNSDLAAGHDTVFVVSCMPMELPPGFEDERMSRFFSRERDGIEALRAAGATVEVIVPDEEFMMISGMGMFLMDFGRVQQAAEAGMRLGKQEADRIRASW